VVQNPKEKDIQHSKEETEESSPNNPIKQNNLQNLKQSLKPKTSHTPQREHNCRRYVMLSQQRSGTHFIQDLIRNLPKKGGRIDNEVFHPLPEPLTEENCLKLLDLRHGFIIQANQLFEYPVVSNVSLKYIQELRLPILYLTRNHFDRVISNTLSRRTRIVHCKNASCYDENLSIYIKPKDFAERMIRVATREKKLQEALATVFKDNEVLHIAYEDFIKDQQTHFCKITQFLECECISLPPANRTTTIRKSHTEIISNKQELLEYLVKFKKTRKNDQAALVIPNLSEELLKQYLELEKKSQL
jgi:hypothetical protein